MQGKSKVVAGATVALALGLGLGASAKAGVVTVTYQGVVTGGSDQTGVFGVSGANLTGDSFVAVYTINDAGGYTYSTPTTNPNKSVITSGYGMPGSDKPPMSGTITINGVTISVPGHLLGYASQSTLDSGMAGIADFLESGGASSVDMYSDKNLNLEIYSTSNPIVTSYDFRTPLSYTIQPGDNASGNFSYERCQQGGINCAIYTVADFAPTSVTISYDPTSVPVPSIPEPGTWAMLIMGMAMIGFAARRRSEGTAVAA